MHNYLKIYTDEIGGYDIQQLRDDGTTRIVSRFHLGFADWLKNNLLPEVEYIKPEPAPIAEPMISDVDKLAKRIETLETKLPTIEAALTTLSAAVELASKV